MKTTEQAILDDLHAIIVRAAAAGLVATISLDHQNPYAMVAAVRPAPKVVGMDFGSRDNAVEALVDGTGKLLECRAIWPDPAKMNFDPDSPDKYNSRLRVTDDKPRRRSTD